MQAVFVAKESISPRRYTPSGLERLSLALKATIFHRDYSERSLARLAGVSHVTVNKYCRGNIYEPEVKVIKALAPFICRVISFSEDGIAIDPTRTYEDDWESLDKLATSEYRDAFERN
jgi:transcriptional regulator with XRE-family HTH domain